MRLSLADSLQQPCRFNIKGAIGTVASISSLSTVRFNSASRLAQGQDIQTREIEGNETEERRRLNQAVFVCLTDRVAATTPFALAEGDFPNPAGRKK